MELGQTGRRQQSFIGMGVSCGRRCETLLCSIANGILLDIKVAGPKVGEEADGRKLRQLVC